MVFLCTYSSNQSELDGIVRAIGSSQDHFKTVTLKAQDNCESKIENYRVSSLESSFYKIPRYTSLTWLVK